MATLHIEHPINDLPTWLAAFSRSQEARHRAGVGAERALQPVGDKRYIYVDLDFDSVEQAVAFKKFLETNGWTSREASPALAGTPRARVLIEADTGRAPAARK
jgi:arginase family enzyme